MLDGGGYEECDKMQPASMLDGWWYEINVTRCCRRNNMQSASMLNGWGYEANVTGGFWRNTMLPVLCWTEDETRNVTRCSDILICSLLICWMEDDMRNVTRCSQRITMQPASKSKLYQAPNIGKLGRQHYSIEAVSCFKLGSVMYNHFFTRSIKRSATMRCWCTNVRMMWNTGWTMWSMRNHLDESKANKEVTFYPH